MRGPGWGSNRNQGVTRWRTAYRRYQRHERAGHQEGFIVRIRTALRQLWHLFA